MGRLTQRFCYDGEDMYGSIGIACDDEQYLEKVYNKLGRLEDLEEELGIDLITLFKALKEGIYYKTIKSGIYHIPDTCLELNYNFGEFNIWVNGHKMLDGLLINLKKYGKTWALTREEFENE